MRYRPLRYRLLLALLALAGPATADDRPSIPADVREALKGLPDQDLERRLARLAGRRQVPDASLVAASAIEGADGLVAAHALLQRRGKLSWRRLTWCVSPSGYRAACPCSADTDECAELCDEQARRLTRRRSRAVERMARKVRPAPVETVGRLLDSRCSGVRLGAIAVLRRLRHPRSVPLLVSAVDRAPPEYSQAVWALKDHGPAGFRAWIGLLGHKSKYVWRTAREQLRFAGPKTHPHMVAAFKATAGSGTGRVRLARAMVRAGVDLEAIAGLLEAEQDVAARRELVCAIADDKRPVRGALREALNALSRGKDPRTDSCAGIARNRR